MKRRTEKRMLGRLARIFRINLRHRRDSHRRWIGIGRRRLYLEERLERIAMSIVNDRRAMARESGGYGQAPLVFDHLRLRDLSHVEVLP